MQQDKHDIHGFLHGAHLVEAEQRRLLAPLGVLPKQARIISAMGELGQVSQAALALAFHVSPASMSTMCDRLVAAEYITRKVDPNSRRQYILELTEKGSTLLDGIDAAWTEMDNTIRDVLGDNSDIFFDMCRQLRDGLGGRRRRFSCNPR